MKYFLILLLSLLSLPAFADEDDPNRNNDFDAVQLAVGATSTHGWKKKLSIGLTGSLSQSSNVPGTNDGSTIQVGTIVDTSLERTRRIWSWLNTLKFQYAQSRTPLLDRFVKSQDQLDIGSIYFWKIYENKAGIYSRVRASTSVSPGYLVKPTDSTISRKHIDGSTTTEPLSANQELSLTSYLEPLLIAEGVGLFANPTQTDGLTVRIRLGAGAQEAPNRNGFVLNDDPKTPAIEIRQLKTSNQVGAEAEISAEGKVNDKFSWKGKVGWFMPTWTSTKSFQTGFSALQTDANVGASYKLSKALSIDWQATAKKIPVVLDKWQLTNVLLITVGYML